MSEKPERAGDLPVAGVRGQPAGRLRELLRPVLRRVAVRGLGRLRDRQAGRARLPESADRTSAAASIRSLRTKGFPGCTVYECFGAGQRVAQQTYHGQDWRQAPATAHQMFDVFRVMRQLHELLWYLAEALTLRSAEALFGDLRRMFDGHRDS